MKAFVFAHAPIYNSDISVTSIPDCLIQFKNYDNPQCLFCKTASNRLSPLNGNSQCTPTSECPIGYQPDPTFQICRRTPTICTKDERASEGRCLCYWGLSRKPTHFNKCYCDVATLVFDFAVRECRSTCSITSEAPDLNRRVCAPCDPSCLTCSVANSPDKCASCNPGFTPSGTRCIKNCNPDEYVVNN
jgi:hypothetical protein